MSDLTPPTPPAAPTPTPNDNVRNGVVGFFALAVLVLGVAIALPGNKSSNSAATPTPTTYTSAIDPIGEGNIAPTNKYDAYYEHMLNNSGKANTAPKASVIQLGDLVCQSLDEGNSVAAVVKVLGDNSADSSDIELAAAAVYGAITYLCPEYSASLSAYLNT